MNDANKAALAALFGITPETHRHLFKVINIGVGDDVAELWNLRNLPDPLGPDADGVWLVPMLLWLHKNNRMPTLDSSVLDSDFDPCPHAQVHGKDGFSQAFDNTFTAALLQACLAARVPEVVAILEVNHD